METFQGKHTGTVSGRIVLVHTVGIVLLFLAGIGTLTAAVYEFNRLSRNAARVMVETQIAALRDKAETTVRDYSVWTEAFEAFGSGDTDWLYRNIGTGAAEIGALDLIHLTGQQAQGSIGWIYGSPPEGEDGVLAPHIAQKIMAARPDDPGAIDWTYANVEMVDGRPWLFTATAIRPIDLEPGQIRFEDLPLQIQGIEITPDVLAELAAPILLDDLRVVLEMTPGGAYAALNGDGSGPGLSWDPPSIGARVLASIFWPLCAAMLLVGAIAALVSRHTVRSAKALEVALSDAQAADRAKSEFLANVSHELKTPINGIIGSIELLQLTALDTEQRELVGILSASAEIELSLIMDLIKVGQLENGRIALDPEPVLPAEIVVETCGMLRNDAIGKGLAFRCEVSGATDRMVLADRRALRQILANLVGNAVKFTDTGSVTVIASGIPDGEEIAWEIMVIDTGPGIAAENRERVFDRFYRVDNSLARDKDGTGLGLAISRDLARAMGGTISVDANTNGTGSVFTFAARFRLRGDASQEIAA